MDEATDPVITPLKRRETQVWPPEMPCRKCSTPMDRRGHSSRGNRRRYMICPSCGTESVMRPTAIWGIINGKFALIECNTPVGEIAQLIIVR